MEYRNRMEIISDSCGKVEAFFYRKGIMKPNGELVKTPQGYYVISARSNVSQNDPWFKEKCAEFKERLIKEPKTGLALIIEKRQAEKI